MDLYHWSSLRGQYQWTAQEHIFGMVVMNKWSARDIQVNIHLSPPLPPPSLSLSLSLSV